MKSIKKNPRYSCLIKQLKNQQILIEKSSAADMDNEAAKSLLFVAFSNKDIQKFSVNEKLCKLKLNSDFSFWICDTKLIESQFTTQNTTSTIFYSIFCGQDYLISIKFSI